MNRKRFLILAFFAAMGFGALSALAAENHEAAGHAESASATAAAHGESAATHSGSPAAHGEGGEHGEGTHGESESTDFLTSILTTIFGDRHQTVPEIPNLFMAIQALLPEDSPVRHFLHEHFHNGWENVFYTYLIVFAVWIVLAKGMKRRLRQPGRFQGAIEGVGVGLFDFFKEVLGEKNARDFVPLVGALFLFIFFNNIIGIVPLCKAPSSTRVTTFALSIPVFFIVQIVGLVRCGLWGRIHHLMGSPRDAVGWALSPLMFVLEVVGELVKPVSLGLRLFGNLLGEDILLGAFAFMGVMLLGVFGVPKNVPVGIPLQFPFLFLALLTSVIQALVFSLLASIYILLALPHHEQEHGEAHKH